MYLMCVLVIVYTLSSLSVWLQRTLTRSHWKQKTGVVYSIYLIYSNNDLCLVNHILVDYYNIYSLSEVVSNTF